MANFTIRKWNSETTFDDFEGGLPPKSSIVNLLNKFLKSRPTKDDLEVNKILKSEYKPIPLRYSLIDILCSHLEKNALDHEGIFRVSGSNQQIRLFWQTFINDNIEFPLNEHTIAGALKLYIREQTEPLIAYDHFSYFISQLGDGGPVTLNAINQLITKISNENLKIIKRVLRVLIIMVRHSQINKMDATNMGIVFGPNIFKSRPDSPNIFSEAKYSNESVSFLISNHLHIFPDLEIPILGTETNTEDSSSSITFTSNLLDNNNNSGGGASASSPSTKSTTPSSVNTLGGGAASSPLISSSSSSSSSTTTSITSPTTKTTTSSNNFTTAPTPFSLSNNNNSNNSTSTSNSNNNNNTSTSASINRINSIINSTSVSKTQLLPIHPSLLDTNQVIERVEGNPLSLMKKKDFSISNHLSNKLQKTKHFKKEEIWDCFLLLKVSGNLVSIGKSSSTTTTTNNITNSTSTSSSNLLSLNGKTKKSTNNLNSTTTAATTTTTSTNVTLTPVYILITSTNLFFFDTKSYNIQHILPHSRLKEVSIDVVNKGLFSILDGETHKLSFFLVPKPKVIDFIVRSLEKGRAIAKLTNKSLASLQSRKFPLLEGNGGGSGGGFGKLPESRPVFESLAQSGFSEMDVWDGVVDLLEVVKKFQNILVPIESKCVVEFLLPAIPEFKGIYRKSYKLDSKTLVYKIICLICEKAKLEPSKFLLRTLKGRTLFDNLSLGDYGLGTLFTSWQLRLITLDSPDNTGNFVVEFLMPDTPEFKGMQKKAIKVDAYQPLKRIMKGLCDKLKIPNHHYYHLIGPEDQILGDNDVLSSIGLGIKFKTCKMKLAKKVFPVGNKQQQQFNFEMVNLLVSDIIDTSFAKIKERHNERIRLYCKGMLDYIVDQIFVEITKAELVPKRVAMLAKNSRYEFYQSLALKEEEDMILLDIAGYRNTVYTSKHMFTNQEPESSSNYPLYRPKSLIPKGPINSIRDIKVNSAKTNFISELKDNNKQQQQSNQQYGIDHAIKPSQKIKYTPTTVITPVINNPNSIVQLLALKPGASKLVGQLKNRIIQTEKRFNILDIEDLMK